MMRAMHNRIFDESIDISRRKQRRIQAARQAGSHNAQMNKSLDSKAWDQVVVASHEPDDQVKNHDTMAVVNERNECGDSAVVPIKEPSK
jgi:hypothetical protein